MLNTKNKFSWTYGRFEARAQSPQRSGHVARRLVPRRLHRQNPLAACGEIDLMEALGRDPTHITARSTSPKTTNTPKTAAKSKPPRWPPPTTSTSTPSRWYPDRIGFFYDQTKYHTVHLDDIQKGPDNPFRKPQYLIVNLALGDWGGRTVDDSKSPAIPNRLHPHLPGQIPHHSTHKITNLSISHAPLRAPQ